jgi:hypothetical protein
MDILKSTNHLPSDVVNEEFVLMITSSCTDPEERVGKSAILWQAATFDSDGQLQEWGDWIRKSERSAEELEFAAYLLAYWSNKLADAAKEKGKYDEKVFPES